MFSLFYKAWFNWKKKLNTGPLAVRCRHQALSEFSSAAASSLCRIETRDACWNFSPEKTRMFHHKWGLFPPSFVKWTAKNCVRPPLLLFSPSFDSHDAAVAFFSISCLASLCSLARSSEDDDCYQVYGVGRGNKWRLFWLLTNICWRA